jgi:hypothetical protein
MPKTAVDENYGAVFWENYVGIARQVFAMQPEAVPGCMQESSDQQFRLGVLAFYCGHGPAPLLWRQDVHD